MFPIDCLIRNRGHLNITAQSLVAARRKQSIKLITARIRANTLNLISFRGEYTEREAEQNGRVFPPTDF